MKKVFSVLIAALMVLALAIPAMAYSIEISNNSAGYTYEAYQIFKGTYAVVGGVDTLGDVEWGDNVDTTTEIGGNTLLAALKADTTIGTALTDCNTAADVAEVMAAWGNDSAQAKAFANVVGKYLTGTPKSQNTVANDKYTITGLASGYYLVKNSVVPDGNLAGTSYILEVVKDVTVTPKTGVPTVVKKVAENTKYNQDGGYGTTFNDVADYNMNDVVDFKLIGTMPANYGDFTSYTYTFHDKQSAGLTFNPASVAVVADNDGTQTTLVANTDYTLVTTGLTDDCTFEVRFADTKTNAAITAATKIIVTYNSTLNTNAVVGLDGNPNEVKLEYSNNPYTTDTNETPVDKVIVFTYELDVTKIDGTNNEVKLEGAEFKLSRLNGANTEYAVLTNGKVTSWTQTAGDATVLTSAVTTGLFTVTGLDDGTYSLTETKAPAGYNILTAPITVVIAATTANGQTWDTFTADTALTAITIAIDGGTATAGDIETGIVAMNVANNSGSTLPSTGGIGTTIFYVIGSVLMLGAAILFITKKRMTVANTAA